MTTIGTDDNVPCVGILPVPRAAVLGGLNVGTVIIRRFSLPIHFQFKYCLIILFICYFACVILCVLFCASDFARILCILVFGYITIAFYLRRIVS